MDNCMTDTYRLKYHHQRPLVLSMPEPRGAVKDGRDSGHCSRVESQTSLTLAIATVSPLLQGWMKMDICESFGPGDPLSRNGQRS